MTVPSDGKLVADASKYCQTDAVFDWARSAQGRIIFERQAEVEIYNDGQKQN